MTKKEKSILWPILGSLFMIVDAEERGSAEHVVEWFDSGEIIDAVKELGLDDLREKMLEFSKLADGFDEDDDEAQDKFDKLSEELTEFNEDDD